MNLLLAFAAASLFGVGTYLVLQRQLSRIVIGVGLIGHGANVLFVISAQGRGTPPFIGRGDPASFTDPLPQALMLTAIVITFGVTAFLLALAYRSWIVNRHDEVEDDIEDRLIARRALQAESADDAETGEGPGEGPEASGVATETGAAPARPGGGDDRDASRRGDESDDESDADHGGAGTDTAPAGSPGTGGEAGQR